MAIWLNINPRSGIPIYVQIVEQVKHALEVGILKPEDELPTVRQLATQLTVAPNTVVKAYNELQQMGLIESRAGRGTIVIGNLNGRLHSQQIEGLFERLHELVRDAAALNVEEAELERRFRAEIQRLYAKDQTKEPKE